MMAAVTSVCLFVCFILAGASAFIVHKQLRFVDCLSAAERSTEYTDISGISLNPDPVILPGNITVGARIKVNTNVIGHGMEVNVTIYKVLLGRRTRIPCLHNVGSCSYDLCELIGVADNGTTSACKTPELLGTGIPCNCPIMAGTYTISPHTFNVPKVAGVFSWLASGDYHIHAEFTDKTKGRSLKAACFDIDVAIENKSSNSGFFFG